MRTVVLGAPPPALRALIEERKRLELDRRDEIWRGELHLAPAPSGRHAMAESRITRLLGQSADAQGLFVSAGFNLGEPEDFRVPDLGVHRVELVDVWIDTAAVVVEVRLPDDETYEKLGFYFDRGVDEVLIADLERRSVTWLARGSAGFSTVDRSALLTITTTDVAEALGWT